MKDALSYIRAALNPDASADFARAIATPSRGIGKVTLAKVINKMDGSLPLAAQRKVAEFRTTLARIEQSLSSKKPSEAVRDTLLQSGMWKLYEDGDSEDAERLENLKNW